MKGLLRNNFYSMGSNLQLSFGIGLVLIFIPLLIGEDTIVSMVLGIQSFIFIANIGTALNTDITSKWSNFEITLPVKRNDIIVARYISFLVLILCGIVMSGMTSLLTAMIFEKISIDVIIYGFAFGVSISLLTPALMYPIMLKIGTEKNEMIIFICAGIAVALLLIVLRIAAPFVPTDIGISGRSVVGIIFVVFSFVVFVLSYFVSRGMYQRKEL